MRYILNGRQPILWVSMYAKIMAILIILAMGLLVWDYVQFGNLMTYVFTGLK